MLMARMRVFPSIALIILVVLLVLQCCYDLGAAQLNDLTESITRSKMDWPKEGSKTPHIPALIVFGDSIADSGNNNNLGTILKSNFAPYGRDFPGAVPTGRFSNGKIITDMIAKYVGLKNYVPAFLDPNLKDEDLLTGVSFASGGAGYDNLTSEITNVLTLYTQFELFSSYIGRLRTIVGEERADYIISNAQYLLVMGNNDIWNTYFTTGLRRQYDIPAYTQLLVNSASDFTKTLYRHGVRRLVVLGLPPLGCVPFVRTLAGGKDRECADTFNQAAMLFNSKLQREVQNLNSSLPGAQITYQDVYYPLLKLIQQPAENGFEVVDRGCCGTGDLEVVILCNGLTPLTCPDPAKYVFWDAFHPTERAYQLIVDQLIPNFKLN